MQAARRAEWRTAEKTEGQVTEWIVPPGPGLPDPRPARPRGSDGPTVPGRSAVRRGGPWGAAPPRPRPSVSAGGYTRANPRERRTPGGPAGHEPPPRGHPRHRG